MSYPVDSDSLIFECNPYFHFDYFDSKYLPLYLISNIKARQTVENVI